MASSSEASACCGIGSSVSKETMRLTVRTIGTLPRVVLLLAWCCRLSAQDDGGLARIPLSVQDAIGTHSFGQLMAMEFSPEGKWLAYAVKNNRRAVESKGLKGWAQTGVPLWASGCDIWVSNVETGQTKRLTDGNGDSWLPSWSPNGHYLAFLSTRDGSGKAKLWTWDTVRDRLRKVIDLEMRSDQIEWTVDSRFIALTILPDGMTGEEYARRVLSSRSDSTSTSDSNPGSTAIVFRQTRLAADAAHLQKSDPLNLNRFLRDLAVVDVGMAVGRVLVRGHRIAQFHVNPDGTRVVYTEATHFESAGSQQVLFNLWESHVATLKDDLLDSNLALGIDGDFSLSPSGGLISYCQAGAEKKGTGDCYVVSSGEKPVNVTELRGSSGSVRGQLPLWDSAGNRFYFVLNGSVWVASMAEKKAHEVANVPRRKVLAIIATGHLLWTSTSGQAATVITRDDENKQDGFYKIQLASGESERLREDGHCYTCANVKEDQYTAVSRDCLHVAYFSEDSQHDSNVWVSDSSFRTPKQLTHLNPQFEKYRFGAVRLIDWLSDDGENLKGALLLPSGYEAGKRYPLIVFVYGGDMLSDHLNHFGLGYDGPLNMQLLATRGYAVLLPDAPERVGTPMLDLAKAVLPGVNKAVLMGIADPKRLGVMGHSRGGYSTLALITQTERFHAAISIDGLGDLISAYGQMSGDGSAFQTSLTEQGQGKIGGTPWQFRERYVENSPIFYFERIETPVLIVHGSNDESVFPFLADEVFVALRRLGKEAEYVKYIGEEHSPTYWSFANQTDYSERMINWFDRWLKEPN